MSSATSDLGALLKASIIEDHGVILKAVNARLKQTKSDLEAQQVKLVALLKLERYDDVLRSLDAGEDRLKQIAKLEQAYALYKIGSFEEASQIAKDIEGDRGARHIEAQAVRQEANSYAF